MYRQQVSIKSATYGVHGVSRIEARVDLEGSCNYRGMEVKLHPLFLSRNKGKWDLDPKRKRHIIAVQGSMLDDDLTEEILSSLSGMLPALWQLPDLDYQLRLFKRIKAEEKISDMPVMVEVQQEKPISIGVQWQGAFQKNAKKGKFALDMCPPDEFEYPIRGLNIDVTEFLLKNQLPDFSLFFEVCGALIEVILRDN